MTDKKDKNQDSAAPSNSEDKEIQEIIKSVPEKEKRKKLKQFVSAHRISHTLFSGPLPPPESLEKYNSAVSNGAERIMQMVEQQSKHRRELENISVKEELRQSRRGQIFGFIVALFGLLCASVLGYFGHSTVAGIFGTTTIVGLVTVFVIGRKSQGEKKE